MRQVWDLEMASLVSGASGLGTGVRAMATYLGSDGAVRVLAGDGTGQLRALDPEAGATVLEFPGHAQVGG
jgi:hypothetical protein